MADQAFYSKVYKQSQGRAETDPNRAVFEEPYESSPIIGGQYVWKDAHLLPEDPEGIFGLASPKIIATPDPDGQHITYNINAYEAREYYKLAHVIEKHEKLQLQAVPGTRKAFQHDSLKNCILNNNFKYSVKLYNIHNTVLNFPAEMVKVDPAAGVLVFYCSDTILDKNSITANTPIRVSFYKYLNPQQVWTDELTLQDPTNYTTAKLSIEGKEGNVTQEYVLPDVVESRTDREVGTILLEQNLEDRLQYCTIDANNAKENTIWK